MMKEVKMSEDWKDADLPWDEDQTIIIAKKLKDMFDRLHQALATLLPNFPEITGAT